MKEIRPDYYKSGGLEAFDVIDAFDLDFNLGNAFKYIARAGKKDNKVEDLRKAVTYLNREIEKEEKARPIVIPDAFQKVIMDHVRKNKLENKLARFFQKIESLNDDKKYHLKSLLSGIDEEYCYLNINDRYSGFMLSNKDEAACYQTEFSKVDIRWLVKDWDVNLDEFEIKEVKI